MRHVRPALIFALLGLLGTFAAGCGNKSAGPAGAAGAASPVTAMISAAPAGSLARTDRAEADVLAGLLAGETVAAPPVPPEPPAPPAPPPGGPGSGRRVRRYQTLSETTYVALQVYPYVSAGGELQGVGSGLGAGLTFGHVFLPNQQNIDLAVETAFGMSAHDDDLVDGASAFFVSWTGGVRLIFNSQGMLRPAIVAGVGIYGILFDSSVYSASDDIGGGGGYIGGEVDFAPAPNISLGLSVRFHAWYGTDSNIPERGGIITNAEVALGGTLYF